MTTHHGPTPASSGEVFRAAPSIVFGELLSTNEDDLITREMVIRAIDPERRTADFVASTGEVDSHGEIVSQHDWQLGDFLRNPVCLFAHQSRELPIGQCTDVAVRNGQLECRILFANKEQNPKAENVWLLVKDKFLRAVSVGFIPQEARYEMRDGKDILVWSKCLLKEISVTPIGANASALAKMKSKALADRANELANQSKGDDVILRTTETKTTKTNLTPASLSGSPTNNEKDPNMDIKELEARVAVLTSEKANAEKLAAEVQKNLDAERVAFKETIDRLKTEASAHEAQVKAITADRDAHKDRGDKLEADGIEREVEALVGKKISPAEKPLYVSLRKTSPDLFTKMVNERPEMRLTEQVIPTEKNNGASGNASIDLFNEVKKSAGL